MGAGGATGGTTGGAMGSGGAGATGAVGGTGGAGGSTGGAGGSTGGSITGGTGGSTTGGTGGSTTGGTGGTGGSTGGSAGAGTGGGSGTGGTGQQGSCNFQIMGQTADKAGSGGIPTVGIVSWSVDNPSLTMASVEFGLAGGATYTAPVDVSKGPNFKTLLLGMKGSKTYTYRIKVTGANGACTSGDQMITTGAVTNDVPRVVRTAGPAAASQAKGFIVVSTGIGSMGGFGGGMMGGSTSGSVAFILDSDGDPVWWTAAPTSCSRAKMSYDGQYMWMVNLNVQNSTKDGGEVARVSMDGLTRNSKIPGLSNCHHDLTILPDGRAACLSWIQQPGDQPSDLIESDYQGKITKIVTLDSNIYAGGSGLGGGTGTYHANAIHYHMADDSYTFSDRNPNLFMKVNRKGEPLWQFGGSCTGAKAPKCVAGTWQVNHGHDMLDDGTFLFFNNGQSGASTAFFYKLTETGTFAATQTGKYSPGTTSNVLGDVQRLPNGNTLVTFSTASKIDEIDASGAVVQSITGPGGYAEWRETLYGPPPRF